MSVTNRQCDNHLCIIFKSLLSPLFLFVHLSRRSTSLSMFATNLMLLSPFPLLLSFLQICMLCFFKLLPLWCLLRDLSFLFSSDVRQEYISMRIQSGGNPLSGFLPPTVSSNNSGKAMLWLLPSCVVVCYLFDFIRTSHSAILQYILHSLWSNRIPQTLFLPS